MDVLIGLEVLLGSWGRGRREREGGREGGGRGDGTRGNTMSSAIVSHDLTLLRHK